MKVLIVFSYSVGLGHCLCIVGIYPARRDCLVNYWLIRLFKNFHLLEIFLDNEDSSGNYTWGVGIITQIERLIFRWTNCATSCCKNYNVSTCSTWSRFEKWCLKLCELLLPVNTQYKKRVRLVHTIGQYIRICPTLFIIKHPFVTWQSAQTACSILHLSMLV